MAQERLKAWARDHDVSDADIMLVLGLTSINQFRNRMNGITPLSPLERRALVEYTGLAEEDLKH